MYSFVKFLKVIMMNKRKIDEDGIIVLTKECNTIIQNKMHMKLNDPGSFSIPYIIRKYVTNKALYDLGASVSLVPLSTRERLTLGELKPTKMCLQLADQPMKYPIGILEDIPLRINQLYILTVFVVMYINEDSHILILLGRSFLYIVGAIIDVNIGKLTFEVGDEKIEFILY